MTLHRVRLAYTIDDDGLHVRCDDCPSFDMIVPYPDDLNDILDLAIDHGWSPPFLTISRMRQNRIHNA
jgi:hypothetical protein